ncbi:MAG: indolepyruvate ferredoxin oxidoreductase, alpha subunit [Eubacteriales bacterium]|nr:indolepyruvate ferredoxin oxidoreductase, alpha subunit [Eubacteriales bacterium]MDN5363067.1 indolepyruvate ferredoxin oxidoreductase, alpha subunit [Eubacteriales bacterium]
MTGNEAIARGAWEAGVRVAAGYPGTPSTEILENLAKYPGVYAQWSPNEKVALEVGIGASLTGARVLVTMKHVGVNVAADPLLTLSYTGVNGGLVLVSADDPGMHSSQNEQDNRHYARLAKIPMLEPADSQEARDFVILAFNVSEEYDTPVLLRTTTRVAHGQSLVATGERQERRSKKYEKNVAKYVMMPAFARQRRLAVEERTLRLKKLAERMEVNRMELRDRSIGVITSGISYQYVREALPHASVLKLGLTWPLPEKLLRQFAAEVDRLYVVEELDPYLEEQIRALGIAVTGKEIIPPVGELSVETVARAFGVKVDCREEVAATAPAVAVPPRPPVMCPGCPHRGVFYVLRKLKVTVTGDIGCYTLGALPPLEAMDTCICMGASIGSALGMEKGDPELQGRVVAVIGDSTFLHSGVTGLMDIVYNKGTATVVILDNRTTAMTGHQDHPASGRTLMGEPAYSVDLAALCRAVGVERVREVPAFDLEGLEKALREELEAREPSVVIARQPCALLAKEKKAGCRVEADQCVACRRCLQLGCPALSIEKDKATIDEVLCNGCGLCLQVCRVGAIRRAGESDG